MVWKLDRLARSTRDLLETMETIREAGGMFRSISEPWAATTSHSGKTIMTIFAGIAEFERDWCLSFASLGDRAPEVQDGVAKRLGLARVENDGSGRGM